MRAASDVSVVVPCFNEGARVAASVEKLNAWFDGVAEILLVDDGSADETWTEAERCTRRHANVRAHRLSRHRGKGAALRASVPLLQTDRVLFIDADLAFDRASAFRALDGLARADVVVGNRRHADSSYTSPVRIFGFLYRRHVAGLMFNRFVRLSLGVSLRDTQCGLKAFRRASLEAIAPALSVDGFAIDLEMLLAAAGRGLRLAEVPVNVRYDTQKSSVSLLRTGWQVSADLARILSRRAQGAYRQPAAVSDLPSAERRNTRDI